MSALTDPIPTTDWNDETVELPAREQIHALVSDAVVYVRPDASIRDAAATLRSADVGLVVVGTAEHPAGVISERDITDAAARCLDLDVTTVDAIEHDDLRWATADAPVGDVAEEMLASHLRHVLVRADDGSLLGVVSMRDVLGALLF